LRDLVSAHESMAGTIAFSTSGDPRDVSTGLASALRRALQESLSNARKHAPGVAVSAELDWCEDRVVLTVSNPIVAAGASTATVTALAATGGGNGLAGMAERFSALPGGSVTAGVRDDCFVVQAEVGLS
jgi:signal transduction histidine kinase